MSVDMMRNYILNAKPYSESVIWRGKVNRWPDKQVIAVYYKFLHEGRFDKKPQVKKQEPEYRQMTLDEFLPVSEASKF